jgi:hypothetical protein
MPRYLWIIVTGILVIYVQRDALARERSYEAPAENVRKSELYDYLLSTNAGFRAYRARKECRPIVNDPALRGGCLASFDTYEPVRK